MLEPGHIDDFDTTYFNGVQVGATGRETPNAYGVLRSYRVSGKLVKAGENVIAIRVFDWAGDGGIVGPADQMRVRLDPDKQGAEAAKPISLAGEWKYKIELKLPQIEFLMPPGTNCSPAGLYNGMIAPLTNLSIRGAIWYQGESNSGQPRLYRSVFPGLINDWRKQFHNPDMPFLFVQLAAFMPRQERPSESNWAEEREAQMMTLLPKTAMAVAIDIGDAQDIHPKNKQEVGRRLALAHWPRLTARTSNIAGPFINR